MKERYTLGNYLRRKREFSESEEKFDKLITKTAKSLADKAKKLIEYSLWSAEKKLGQERCEQCGTRFSKNNPPEVHHHPLTATEVMENILRKFLDEEDKQFTSLDVINEFLRKHYSEEIDVVVICRNCHTCYHTAQKTGKSFKISNQSEIEEVI